MTSDVSSELDARINELLRDALLILAEAGDGSHGWQITHHSLDGREQNE